MIGIGPLSRSIQNIVNEDEGTQQEEEQSAYSMSQTHTES